MCSFIMNNIPTIQIPVLITIKQAIMVDKDVFGG